MWAEDTNLRPVLSSMSLLNPFFGYPAAYDAAATPSLRHGRRRKRDLLYTLARLWWARWRSLVKLTALILILVLVLGRPRLIANFRTRQRQAQIRLLASPVHK